MLMGFYILIFSSFISMIILFLFYLLSKFMRHEEMNSSSFECGFSSYFYSRFSFSIHYFMVAMIFLFLDLELCILLPSFMEVGLSPVLLKNLSLFVSSLLMGLFLEWVNSKLEWLS